MVAACVILGATARGAEAQAAKPPSLSDGSEPRKILLWVRGAPGALGNEETDQPSLLYFPPWEENESGTCVIVAPGGGYGGLATNHEGRQAANYFNAMGIAAFVLTYRLGPSYHHPIELGDVQRAIRLVRSRAAEFGVRADRIGIMGFSAGGHLAATAGTHFDTGKADAGDPIDRASSRPDFLILAYPVITMKAPFAHTGSRKNLLGENPDPKLVDELSNETQVTAQTPPTFIFTTSDDSVVPVENSVMFYSALHKAGVAAELHVFESGPHGVGLDLADPSLGEWPKLLTDWMVGRGLLSAPK
jgi:acetyl esterase/lipase